MSENQKVIGDFLVVWKNQQDHKPEFHIFHSHATEKETNDYKYCVQATDESEKWVCRICEEKVPAGVVYYGKTRRLNENNA